MRFRLDREHFQICGFSEKTPSILVCGTGGIKHSRYNAFSKENALVWSKRKEYVFCGVPV